MSQIVELERAIDLCKNLSQNLNICYNMVNRQPTEMQRILKKLFAKMGDQKYHLEDYLHIQFSKMDPFGFRTKKPFEKVAKLESSKKSPSRVQKGQIKPNESPSINPKATQSTQFKFPQNFQDDQSKLGLTNSLTSPGKRATISFNRHSMMKQILLEREIRSMDEKERVQVLSMPYLFVMLYCHQQHNFNKMLELAQRIPIDGRRNMIPEGIIRAFQMINIDLAVRANILKELVVFTSYLGEFIMQIKQHEAKKSYKMIMNIVSFIDSKDFRQSKQIDEEFKNLKPSECQEKLERWNFNNMTYLLDQNRSKNIIELIKEMEYDSRSKFKINQDSQRINLEHRKFMDKLLARLKENQESHENTMVVLKQRENSTKDQGII